MVYDNGKTNFGIWITVWQTVSQTEMKKLDAIQRKALALCLSLPSTAALDALEVAAGIPPLNLRYSQPSL